MQTADFYGVLEVDKFHQGETTQADVGAMTIAEGSWGSSGTEIEGDVKSFSAEAFLAIAEIIAGNIGLIKVTDGSFEGKLTLTDPEPGVLPTLTVDSNFTGSVVSFHAIKTSKSKVTSPALCGRCRLAGSPRSPFSARLERRALRRPRAR